MKLRRLPTLFIALLAFVFSANGQDADVEYTDTTSKETEGRFWDCVYVGGTAGAQFGDVTFVDVSPNMGFLITENRKLSVGFGITYQYLNINDDAYSFDTHTFGGRVFGRYLIWQGITAQAEFEVLSLECYRPQYGLQRKGIPGLLVGGGYTQSIGSRSGVSIYPCVLQFPTA